MSLRSRHLLAAVFGLGIAQFVPAGEPGRLGLEGSPPLPAAKLLSDNQQLANAIADQLRQSGQLHGYRVDLAVVAGRVEVRGVVADQPQREEVLRIVQGVPGVERVLDRLTLADSEAIRQVQLPPAPLRTPVSSPLTRNGDTPPAPRSEAPAEPVPSFQAPQPRPTDLNPPRMPPYAWPTYAPYNNYSRVAAPTAYPSNAWPFIGPCHPFPKIPLGWRSVKLEWEDGHWWFSRVGTKHDWWRLRYW